MYLFHNKLGVSEVSLCTRSSTKARAQVTKREKNAKHQITKLACSCTSRWKEQKWRVSLECLYYYSHACVQRPPLGNGKVTVIYRVKAIQVNFAENIKQLKILGSFLVTLRYRVTAIYRAVIYRFECSVINFIRNSVRQHPIKRGQHANEVVNKPSVLILQFYRQCTCTFSIHKVFFRLDYQLLFGKWFHTPPTKRHLEGWVCYTYFHQHSSSHFFSGSNKTKPKRVAESEKKTSCFAKKMLSKYRIFCLKYQLQWQKLCL